MRISQILILLILLFVPFSGCIGENQSSTLNTQESDTLPMTWMINDYDTGVTYDFLKHSREAQLQQVNSDEHIFFVTEFRYEGSDDLELWKSDGSSVGTEVVFSGLDGINLGVFFDGYLYFSADYDIRGHELWKTDGTFEGTVLVKDINYGEGSSYPSNFVIFNDEVFFTTHPGGASGANKEVIIWKTDGTDSGTVPISNMSFHQLGHFTPLNDKLIFIDFGGGGKLYVMTQTNYEISLLSSGDSMTCISENSIELCSVSITQYARKRLPLPVINDKIIFPGKDGVNGVELWESDGTTGGTSLLKIINPITKQDRENSPIGDEIWEDSAIGDFIISSNGEIYFWAWNGSEYESDDDYWGTQKRIWITDGTENGTKRISLVSNLSENNDESQLIVVPPLGGQAYSRRASLWIVQNEFQLYEFNNLSYSNSQAYYGYKEPYVIGEHVFGTIYNDTFGNEFGKSDGTPNGTILLKDIYSGNESSYPVMIGIINDVLLFEADDGNGTALWAHRVANNQLKSDISDDPLTKDLELFVNKFKPFILPVIGVIVLFVLLVNLKRIHRRKKESLELEELDTEFDEYVRDFFPNSNSNKPVRTNISEFKSDDKPPYSFKGEINEDGWEICEYPRSSEIWWWKDYETETWVLWE